MGWWQVSGSSSFMGVVVVVGGSGGWECMSSDCSIVRVHKGDSCCWFLVCVLFFLVWKHVCWGKGIGRTIWQKEIRKEIVKRERERCSTNMKFPRRGINMCWFSKSVTQTSTLNLKHQNQLCCFVAICKEHRAPVHKELFPQGNFNLGPGRGKWLFSLLKLMKLGTKSLWERALNKFSALKFQEFPLDKKKRFVSGYANKHRITLHQFKSITPSCTPILMSQ